MSELGNRHSFNYGGAKYDYALYHFPEKQGSISIHVFPNGAIQVDAPCAAQPKEIKDAVLKRARWITTRVEEAQQRLKYILPREYVSGESHYYLGRRYLLKVLDQKDTKPNVKLLRGRLEVVCSAPDTRAVAALLEAWYRERAANILKKRMDEVTTTIPWLSVTPPMKLLRMKKQWGSCSVSGQVILNPDLVKAPRECIDYVITHEICHLREHNHSQRFYRELDRLLPTWRSTKGRLDGMAEAILAR